MRFQGKTVIVTGAAKGIGRAAALDFAREGARAIISDLDGPALAATAQDIRDAGGTVEAVCADSATQDGVKRIVHTALAGGRGIDAAFCNAGIRGRVAPITSYEEADFDEIVRINLKGAFLGLRFLLPVMVEQGYGAVVVTSSNSALAGLSSMPGYVATKHGTLGLVRSAALDVAAHGVRVNAVLPGGTRTPLLNELYALASPGNPDAAAARYAASVPTGRLLEPEEISAMALYLCSDRARHITGACFVVDGGRAIGTATTTAGMQEQRAPAADTMSSSLA